MRILNKCIPYLILGGVLAAPAFRNQAEDMRNASQSELQPQMPPVPETKFANATISRSKLHPPTPSAPKIQFAVNLTALNSRIHPATPMDQKTAKAIVKIVTEFLKYPGNIPEKNIQADLGKQLDAVQEALRKVTSPKITKIVMKLLRSIFERLLPQVVNAAKGLLGGVLREKGLLHDIGKGLGGTLEGLASGLGIGNLFRGAGDGPVHHGPHHGPGDDPGDDPGDGGGDGGGDDPGYGPDLLGGEKEESV